MCNIMQADDEEGVRFKDVSARPHGGTERCGWGGQVVGVHCRGHAWCNGQHVCFPSLSPMLGATGGVTVSMSAFLACHQC